MHKEALKIFLFTCVKDGRKYIAQLFDSLLNQTDTNFVHFIYDNGSYDPIDDLVISYKEKAVKLKAPYEIIYEKTPESVGLNIATKYCISKCDKPYFIWIDCDNWVDKDFIKYLSKTIKHNPDCMLYRTFLMRVDGDNAKISSNYKQRKLSMHGQNNAAFTFFTRKNRYYYSFFAVNTKQYITASNNNILSDRDYYNDEQVLAYCYLAKGKYKMVKKAKGYYLARNDSEAHLILPKQKSAELFAYETRIDRASQMSNDAKDYYLVIDSLFKEYNLMQEAYVNKKYDDSRNHFKELYRLSRENHFSTKVTFRNKDFLYWFFVLFIKKRRAK